MMKKFLSANKINTDPEDKQINSPSGRTEVPRDRREERSRKRRKLQEIAVTEERERKPIPTNFRTPNARARMKVKARQLILEADSSTESSVAASQGRHTSKEGAELEA